MLKKFYYYYYVLFFAITAHSITTQSQIQPPPLLTSKMKIGGLSSLAILAMCLVFHKQLRSFFTKQNNSISKTQKNEDHLTPKKEEQVPKRCLRGKKNAEILVPRALLLAHMPEISENHYFQENHITVINPARQNKKVRKYQDKQEAIVKEKVIGHCFLAKNSDGAKHDKAIVTFLFEYLIYYCKPLSDEVPSFRVKPDTKAKIEEIFKTVDWQNNCKVSDIRDCWKKLNEALVFIVNQDKYNFMRILNHNNISFMLQEETENRDYITKTPSNISFLTAIEYYKNIVLTKEQCSKLIMEK